ncbi:MAG: hypothetical protein LBG49_00800 [Mycoplasmataceae bacterium]|nr:hypothetical protein [Mycoplasmataceae bacterium]
MVKIKNKDRNLLIAMCIIGIVFGLASNALSLITVVFKPADISIFANNGYRFILEWCMQFTHLTNLLLIVAYFLFIFGWNKLKIFKNNNFLTRVVSYITLVMIVAWFALTPIVALNHFGGSDNTAIARTLFEHTTCPIIFIIFYVLQCKYNPNIKYQQVNLWKQLSISFIYPTVYFVFIVIFNHIPMPSSVFNQSSHVLNFDKNIPHYLIVYPQVTNYNPKAYEPNVINGYVYWNDKDVNFYPKSAQFIKGNYLNLIEVIVMLWSFFVFYILFLYISLWLTQSKLIKRGNK